jgi:aryl-alcohol dehydrogenase-like predicted oxidoreductase
VLVATCKIPTLDAMNSRIFGKTGRLVSEVGLGTWQIGGNWGNVTDDEALLTLKAAVDAGTNFFDTADVYGDGRSETLIGRFLRESKLRDQLFIAT